MQIVSAPDYVTEGMQKNDDFYNRNRLISNEYAEFHNSMCRGLCAGYTNTDGACVATIADNGEISYLCIIMGATGIAAGAKIADEALCYSSANKLIKKAYSSYGYIDILSSDQIICELPVEMSIDTKSVLVVPEISLRAFLPLSTIVGEDITYTTKITEEVLKAPITEGETVGFITVYEGSREIATVSLVTKTSVNQSDILVALNDIKEFTQSRFFIATVISAVIITIIYIIGRAIYRGSVSKTHNRYRR
jgi:D-alanyl-D-alanine carboxypeptidase